MIKHDCIIVVSYSYDMTFEEVDSTEKAIRTSIESTLERCTVESCSHDVAEDTFTLRYELNGILPLHLLRDMAKGVVKYLPNSAECRILLYSSNLGVIKGAICKEGDYEIQSLDAVQSIGHRTIPFLHEEKTPEYKIFS